VRLYH